MKVQVINISENELPKYETSQSAGMDVRADFSRVTPDKPIKAFGDCEIIFKGEGHAKTMLRLDPGARALIPTGLRIALPEPMDGYRAECQVRPRSGLSLKDALAQIEAEIELDKNVSYFVDFIKNSDRGIAR